MISYDVPVNFMTVFSQILPRNFIITVKFKFSVKSIKKVVYRIYISMYGDMSYSLPGLKHINTFFLNTYHLL